MQEALEIFGADRLMVGSDWPVSAATGHDLGYVEWFGASPSR
jgi:predicted TIM-barrel fold metal-dependent hydrolase